jgi:hypothetical protein
LCAAGDFLDSGLLNKDTQSLPHAVTGLLAGSRHSRMAIDGKRVVVCLLQHGKGF